MIAMEDAMQWERGPQSSDRSRSLTCLGRDLRTPIIPAAQLPVRFFNSRRFHGLRFSAPIVPADANTSFNEFLCSSIDTVRPPGDPKTLTPKVSLVFETMPRTAITMAAVHSLQIYEYMNRRWRQQKRPLNGLIHFSVCSNTFPFIKLFHLYFTSIPFSATVLMATTGGDTVATPLRGPTRPLPRLFLRLDRCCCGRLQFHGFVFGFLLVTIP